MVSDATPWAPAPPEITHVIEQALPQLQRLYRNERATGQTHVVVIVEREIETIAPLSRLAMLFPVREAIALLGARLATAERLRNAPRGQFHGVVVARGSVVCFTAPHGSAKGDA